MATENPMDDNNQRGRTPCRWQESSFDMALTPGWAYPLKLSCHFGPDGITF